MDTKKLQLRRIAKTQHITLSCNIKTVNISIGTFVYTELHDEIKYYAKYTGSDLIMPNGDIYYIVESDLYNYTETLA